MPPNFANGKVYAIRSHQTDKIYIGSTTQTLARRFCKHKQLTNLCSSRQILVFDDAYIELLEEFSCANKMQLNRREGELIRTMDCVNKQIAGRTLAEYYIDNKEYHNQQMKQYRIDNKQTINEHQNQKYNCFCSGKYTNSNKANHSKTAKHIEFMQTLETTTA